MFKSIKICKDQTFFITDILDSLIDFGYARRKAVAEEGDLAVRGSVMDVFPLGFDMPLRIEFSPFIESTADQKAPHPAREDVEKVNFLRSYEIDSGKMRDEHMAVIILPITGIFKKKIKRRQKSEEYKPVSSFVDIVPGDHVVHIKHGIGLYLGARHVKVRGRYREHFVIEYMHGEKVYIKSDDVDLIQKYIGLEGTRPKLHRLGGNMWRRDYKKASDGVIALAKEMLDLQAKRLTRRGYAFSIDGDWQRDIEKLFPYKETPDQLKAIADVKSDMEKPHPMDRLICGDVGYGKTEVALRAAVKAALDGKQVAVLVPTTLLARQHYEVITKRLDAYPLRVEMLSRFKSKSRQKSIIKELKEGKIDIIVGTHRLLTADVGFYDIGLVIIDEEQRFGVRAKERLKRLRESVDIITMSATPIPRTLYLAMMGARDISTIATPPQNRNPIRTKVAEYSDAALIAAISDELKRKGQVFFVHNRIKNIESAARVISGGLPGARIALAHGKMRSDYLEKTVMDFVDRKYDVLVCTNIIESGIDMANVNTIIINNADCFGLADLYQLRGRVGRTSRKAYCYLLYAKKKFLEKDARRRLELIEEYTDLGSGFRIAMEDLSMRGAGNILGTRQHGFINAIGFDLYCRLLNGAIGNLSTESIGKSLK